ncbi:MAG: NAD-dependent epimerase/dehydratase family protein [Pseudomonadota bacterium]
MRGLAVVTGGGGFLGRHVCAALVQAGWRVRALDLRFEAEPEGEAVEGSILDEALLAETLHGASAVVHAAAIAELWTKDAADYQRVNADGTARVAAAARKAGARLAHVSSYTTLVSGPDRPERTLDETAEIDPANLLGAYPQSKRRGELAVLAEVERGLEASILLPSSPVGPGDLRLTPPSKMIRDFARGALPAYLDCLMNLVDVRAVAAGIVAALERGARGGRYLLSGDDLPLAEVAAKISAVTGVPAPKARAPYRLAWCAARAEAELSRLTGKPPAAPLTGVRLAGRRVRFSNQRARQELGFAPPPIDQALKDALDWMAAEGLIPQLAG